MNTPNKFHICAVALLLGATAWGQSTPDEKFALKARADFGLGDPMSVSASMPGMSRKSTCNEFGFDFGWTFWRQQNHSLEANLGVSYNAVSTKLATGSLDYSYSAPAAADMDGDTYIRYYEVDHLRQRHTLGRLVLPLYLDYSYRCNSWLGVHADLGLTFGFKVVSRFAGVSGEGYSYGVYPQYDDLMIDAAYLNDFGNSTYTKSMLEPANINTFTCGFMAGVGAEFRIGGPMAVALDLRYNRTFNNLYKPEVSGMATIDAANAPVTYLVKEGQQVKPLTDYLKSSKLSLPSLQLSLIYRF